MATLVIGAGSALGLTIGAGTAQFIATTATSIALGAVQRLLTPDTTVRQEGPRLQASQILGASEGATIPQLIGTRRFAGQVVWSTRFNEIRTTNRDTQGGKGGGPTVTTKQISYQYTVSLAIALCESDGDATLGRVWADGRELDLSEFTYRFYDGASDQLPDPKIEAVEGVGTVPAYRGVAYLVLEDFLLTDFGNRIPQITCEVNRPSTEQAVTAIETAMESVTIGPGTGEFLYGTTAYSADDGKGNSTAENGNGFITSSLDQLQRYAPNVASVSIVAAWFGDSLDATVCTVRPKTESASKVVVPSDWVVNGVNRASSLQVSEHDRGTPADVTIREAVIEAKARGLRVMFYPTLLMDISGTPWRGDVTGVPTNFVGTAAPGNFSRSNGVVSYSGPAEWTHRRMILHYATLLGDLLTAGDAFLIGSQMAGLSAQAAWGTALDALLTDAQTKLAAGVMVSYAAHWTEYDATSLTPLWTSADMIGIDWFAPLTDWRDQSDEDYSLTTFQAGVTGGEYWDYFYASESDRDNEIRTPITVAADRQKDFLSWRDTNHPGTDVWITATGCPAIDKGANQPDAALPYYSTGQRNDTVQRLYIEAVLSSIGVDDVFVWTWDARPYVSDDAWRTGQWISGRLGGASLVDTVRQICVAAGVSTDTQRISNVPTRVRGFIDGTVQSGAGRLENIIETYLLDVYEDAGTLVFLSRSDADTVAVDLDDMIMRDENRTYVKTRVRDTELPDRMKVDFSDELRDYNPTSVDSHTVTGNSQRVASFTSMSVLRIEYARALADALVHEKWVGRDTIEFTLPFSSEATGNTYLDVLAPGKVFTLLGRTYRIRRLTVGDEIEVEAQGYNSRVYSAVEHRNGDTFATTIPVFGSSFALFPDVPLASATVANPWSPRVAVRQSPWPGGILIYENDELNTTIVNEAIIGETTTALGKSNPWVWDDANTVTISLYDDGAALSTVTDTDVLNGANAMMVLTPSGQWEVFQFTNAALNGDGTYTLSRLLRGQLGTEAYMGDPTPAGSPVILYDDTVALGYLEGTTNKLGVALALRYGPSGVEIGDDRYTDETVTPRGVAYRPYAPTHLAQEKDGADIVFSWIRRTRFDGDTWDQAEVPLNEEYERYEIDVLDGPTVVRTIAVSNATTATYTGAQQVSDFGSQQATVSWNVYQLSATFGRGSPANG